MSGGRVELGIGAGWFEAEHTAYGIPFPALGERFDRYEEQLAVITGLWGTPPGETFDFEGRHYPVHDSPALPKPVQDGGIPVIVGGAGKKRTPRLAARYAREFNVPFASADDNARLFAGVRDACEEAGRDPSSLVYSSALVLCVGRDEAEIARRAAAIGRDVDDLRAHGVAGHAGRGGRHPGPVRRRRARSGSTCRCSTSPTSTTSTWWPPRSRRSSLRRDRGGRSGDRAASAGRGPARRPAGR